MYFLINTFGYKHKSIKKVLRESIDLNIVFNAAEDELGSVGVYGLMFSSNERIRLEEMGPEGG